MQKKIPVLIRAKLLECLSWLCMTLHLSFSSMYKSGYKSPFWEQSYGPRSPKLGLPVSFIPSPTPFMLRISQDSAGAGPQQIGFRHFLGFEHVCGFRWAYLVAQSVKNWPTIQETTCNAEDWGLINFWVGKIPWRRKWQLTPVFLPRKSQEEPGRVQSMELQELDMTWQLNHYHHDFGYSWGQGFEYQNDVSLFP